MLAFLEFLYVNIAISNIFAKLFQLNLTKAKRYA